MFRSVLIAGLVMVAACSLPKPPPPAPPRHTNLGLSIKTVTLPNGLRVVVVNDPQASEVQVTMRYRVGAAEDMEHPGIAHFVEHLMFQQVLGDQTLFAHLEDKTTFFNAFTSFDATTFISRARPEYLDKLLSIEAVRLGFRCASISDSAFTREREVVTQEVKLRTNVDELIVALHGLIYPEGHPYRGRIAGSVETVSAITRDDACKFADAYYAPGNAALVVSGNLSAPQLEAAFNKFLARIPKRTGAAPGPVPAARKLPAREATAPIDEEALLVTWPLPPNPDAQLGVRTIAKLVTGVIDGVVKGPVEYIELGDVRAGVVGFVVGSHEGETLDDVLKKVRKELDQLPGDIERRSLIPQAFDALRQHAIYERYASLEDGSGIGGDDGRDVQFAEHVLAGRDPSQALAVEFQLLRDLDKKAAAGIARIYLGFDEASIVKLKPSSTKKRGHSLAVREATHDMGQRRSVPDIARAHEADTTAKIPAVGAMTRVLPNGLKVVFLPLSTVPTVDIRLVFGAGTADEPADKRGAAALAAYALGWDLRHINDWFAFAIAGGQMNVGITQDRTSFAVQGVDMHLDYLLAGLERWVVEGRYSDLADARLDALQREPKRADNDTVVADAWNAAMYGANHPYARAGLLRFASRDLAVEDAMKFRASYFTPDNATLVVAGHVDVALANRWIDFLFSDWHGTAQPRQAPAAMTTAASIAKLEELTQMRVSVGVPSRSGTLAQRLVAAAMLEDIAHDVRHQLGAAYVFEASLDENRLATSFFLGGWIDPSRANEVVQLLRDRIAALHDDPDATARAFVIARGRVITSLASLTGSASLLAARVETDIALGRAPLADLQTARQVQALTIEQMTPVLADLDLSQAAILMRGPAEPVKGAFKTLGREPTFVRFDQVAQDTDDKPEPTPQRTRSHEQELHLSDIESALTVQEVASMAKLELTVAATLVTSNVSNVVPPGQMQAVEGGPSGYALFAQLGARFSRRFSAGLMFGIGSLDGEYDVRFGGSVIEHGSYDLIPVDGGAYFNARLRDQLWGGVTAGFHSDGVRFNRDDNVPDERLWSNALGLGVELGYDIVGLGGHWLTVLARANAGYGSDVGFGAFGIGVGYHH